MTASVLAPLVRRLAGLPAPDVSDADLLDRFRRGGEEAAFTLLVQRHGPAVLGVCRRLLGSTADADDAFQATFLVLLRKADTVRRGASLGSWLYGVACRVAAKARDRRPSIALSGDLAAPGGDPAGEAARRELTAVLDEEVRGLPEKYRAPLVLCGLGGKSCEQAARELGWPKSTLTHRLARARELLRRRLSRRGVTVPAALLASVLAEQAAANVPALLALDTVRLARQVAAGGSASAAAVALAEQAAKGSGVRWAVALGLAAAVGLAAVAAGTFGGAGEGAADPPAPPAARRDEADAAGRADRDDFPLPDRALARVGSPLLRDGSDFCRVHYSPDGTLLASLADGSLRLWDARTGRPVREIAVPGAPWVPDKLFSADGRTVVVADATACRWFDVRTGEEVRRREFNTHARRSLPRLDAHGEMLAVAEIEPGRDLVVYDLRSGEERFRAVAETPWSGGLAFSGDGKTLAALRPARDAPGHSRIRFFDTSSGRVLGEFDPGEAAGVPTFSPDGKRLLGHNYRKRLTVWAVPSGEPLRRIEVGVNALTAAAFAPDGKSAVVGSQDLDAVQIDLATGKELRRFRTYPSSNSLAFSPDGKTLAVSASGVLSQWDLATGRRLAASADPVAGFWRLRFDRDSKLLWVVDSEKFAAVDWATGRVVRRLCPPPEVRNWSLGLSPGWSRAVSFDAPGGWAVRDTASGKELCRLAGAEISLCRPAFAPDGRTLYAGQHDGPVRGWDASTGKERPAFDAGRRFTHALAVSPDGRWLAAADNPQASINATARPEVTVWDLVAGREHRRLLPAGDGWTWALAFGPDGHHLAAVGCDPRRNDRTLSGFLAVWDVRSGEAKVLRTEQETFMAVAFSGDGRTVVTGGEDKSVRLWEVATGQERCRFRGHARPVYDLAVSEDGKLVAAASPDAPVFVWDVEGRYGKLPSAVPLSAAEATALWDALAKSDGYAAFEGMRRLLARPGPAVALLRDRVRPAAPVDAAAVRRRLRDLDDDTFAVRETAAAELEAVAVRAAPLLRQALEEKPSAEARRRIGRLLEVAVRAAPERWREVRAVEVLERIDTAEARELLKALSGGAEGAVLTDEARAALGRLRGR